MADPKTVILDILRSAERNNARLSLCGMLYYDTLTYMQMIEGPEANVVHMMALLRSDPRHDFIWESHDTVPCRSFRIELPMGYIDETDLKLGAIDLEPFSRRKSYALPQSAEALRFLIAAGRQKYPSMSN
jgi:hypothetical protein